MQTYEYIVRQNHGPGEQRVLASGETQASRAAVAYKNAAENVKDRPPKGEWIHVSLKRTK